MCVREREALLTNLCHDKHILQLYASRPKIHSKKTPCGCIVIIIHLHTIQRTQPCTSEICIKTSGLQHNTINSKDLATQREERTTERERERDSGGNKQLQQLFLTKSCWMAKIIRRKWLQCSTNFDVIWRCTMCVK